MPQTPAIDHTVITLQRRVEVCLLKVEPNRERSGPRARNPRPWTFVFSVVVDGHQFIETFLPHGGKRPEATEVWDACVRRLQRDASMPGPGLGRE